MKLISLLLVLVGCVRLAHVEPQPRYYYDALETVVKVDSYCAGKYHGGTGVVISERHVLTAAHITECHDIPNVHVTLHNGDRHRVYVTREDERKDIARLELAHAGSFGLNIAPPLLAPPVYDPNVRPDFVQLYRYNVLPETVERISPTLLVFRVRQGDSGSPIYDNGLLVGLVVSDLDGVATRITLVTETWLQGT